jgi:hypothetical protein
MRLHGCEREVQVAPRQGGRQTAATTTDRARDLHHARRRVQQPGQARIALARFSVRESGDVDADHVIQADARNERLRYDGFRAFLLGRDPSRRLADAFARQIVARGEQARYGYPPGTGERTIAQDFYYWVCDA